jgi:hypothetical protein
MNTKPGNGEHAETQEENLPVIVQSEIVSPAVMMRQATDVAGVSAEIVKKTAVTISGRKHVRVEGWQAIAIAHGCMLSARDVNRIEGGVRAMGEVRRMSDGALLATAEGFVGDDEKTWAGRAEYAKRAMAQTRAMSRAARSAFAHVVVMIDSEMSTTPAEEIPEEEHKPAKAPEQPETQPAPVISDDAHVLAPGEEVGKWFWKLSSEQRKQFIPEGCKYEKIGGKWICNRSQ